jgi:hypothetical protein
MDFSNWNWEFSYIQTSLLDDYIFVDNCIKGAFNPLTLIIKRKNGEKVHLTEEEIKKAEPILRKMLFGEEEKKKKPRKNKNKKKEGTNTQELLKEQIVQEETTSLLGDKKEDKETKETSLEIKKEDIQEEEKPEQIVENKEENKEDLLKDKTLPTKTSVNSEIKEELKEEIKIKKSEEKIIEKTALDIAEEWLNSLEKEIEKNNLGNDLTLRYKLLTFLQFLKKVKENDLLLPQLEEGLTSFHQMIQREKISQMKKEEKKKNTLLVPENKEHFFDYVMYTPLTYLKGNLSVKAVYNFIEALGGEIEGDRAGSRVGIKLNGIKTSWHQPHGNTIEDTGRISFLRRLFLDAGAITEEKETE